MYLQASVEADSYSELDLLLKADFKVGLADRLQDYGVSPESITVATVKMTPGDDVAEIEFRIAPIELGPAGPLSIEAFEKAFGDEESLQEAMLLSVHGVSRVGVCGNHICEVGEQTVGSIQGSCPGDCQFSFNICPAGGNAKLCSGHGRCIPANGICDCYPGYTGPACEECQGGYDMVGSGICAIYFGVTSAWGSDTEAHPNNDSGSEDKLLTLSVLIAVVCLLAVALVSMVAYHWAFLLSSRAQLGGPQATKNNFPDSQ